MESSAAFCSWKTMCLRRRGGLVLESGSGGWEGRGKGGLRVAVDALRVGDGARVEGGGLAHGEDFEVGLGDGKAGVFLRGGGEGEEGEEEEGEEEGEMHFCCGGGGCGERVVVGGVSRVCACGLSSRAVCMYVNVEVDGRRLAFQSFGEKRRSSWREMMRR